VGKSTVLAAYMVHPLLVLEMRNFIMISQRVTSIQSLMDDKMGRNWKSFEAPQKPGALEAKELEVF
jgi:hypothetical protein